MRGTPWSSPRLIAIAFAVTSFGVLGCSKDSTGPGANGAPAADFASSCSDLTCSFSDLSRDPDGQVMSHAWDFGDGQGASAQAPSHTFPAAGPFTVKLTVTDNLGSEGSITKLVTVSDAQAGAPSADFSVSCASLDCTFHDLSTDANGTVVAWAWDFGDGQTSAAQNPPVHHYAATTRSLYAAQLTVTDDHGLTSTKTAEITVSPPAELQCEDAPGTGHFASCDLILDGNASVTVKLVSRSCDARGDAFQITAPVAETLFSDGCYSPAEGTEFQINSGAVFPAGTHLRAHVISGATNQVSAPALHVRGAYPTWTLDFDDGVGGAHEPDFNDLVLKITAHPAP